MSGEAVYLDSSAFVKLFIPEEETIELRRYLLRQSRWVSSTLLRTETLRAAMKANPSRRRMDRIHRALRSVVLIPLDAPLSAEAGVVHPPELRSLDAIHLATARSLGDHIRAVVTYDERLANVARWHGLTVASPA